MVLEGRRGANFGSVVMVELYYYRALDMESAYRRVKHQKNLWRTIVVSSAMLVVIVEMFAPSAVTQGI